MYKIIIDTNFIHCEFNGSFEEEIIGSSIFELKKFIERLKLRKKIEICLPKMVLHERLAQILRKINKSHIIIDKNLKILSNFGVKPSQPYDKKSYKKILEKEFKKIIKKNKFSVIPLPKIKISALIERALSKIPPFKNREGVGDAGFKDTIIWLSMLQCAKENKNDNFVFLTNNTKDFQSNEEVLIKEFSKNSRKKLKFVSDLAELKQFLDSELGLKLNIELVNKSVGKILGGKGRGGFINEIIDELNQKAYYYAGFSKMRIIDWFKFSGYDIEDIKKIDKETYLISLAFIVLAKLGLEKTKPLLGWTALTAAGYDSTWVMKNSDLIDSSYGWTTPSFPTQNHNLEDKLQPANFEIKLIYSQKSGELKINNILPQSPVTLDSI